MTRPKKDKIDKKYLEYQSENITQEDLKKLNKKKKRLKKILSLKAFSSQKEKLKLFIEILKQYQKGNYREVPWRSITAITFTFIYIINPLDIIPDVLPIVGYVDDLSVFMTLLSLAEKDLNEYENWKAKQELDN